MATRARGAPRRESPRGRFPARRSRHTFGDRGSGCRTIRRGSSQTSSSGTFTRIYSRVPCRGRSRASRCSSRRLADESSPQLAVPIGTIDDQLSRNRPGALSYRAIAALFVISCGGSNPSGPAGPSPDPSVHNTLNAADNRTALSLRYSYIVTDQFGRTIGPKTYDDFVSPTATSIRAVSWQAAYCDPRF